MRRIRVKVEVKEVVKGGKGGGKGGKGGDKGSAGKGGGKTKGAPGSIDKPCRNLRDHGFCVYGAECMFKHDNS